MKLRFRFCQSKLSPQCPTDHVSLVTITSQVALVVKNPPANAGDKDMLVRFLGWEDLLEKGMATHSGILAWKIPWTEEPGGLQSIGLQRVRRN